MGAKSEQAGIVGSPEGFPPGMMRKLLTYNMDYGCLRPWGYDGKTYVTLNQWLPPKDQKIVKVANSPSLITKDAYRIMDQEILRAAREELAIVDDLVQAGLTMNLPNGMAHSMLQWQTMSNIGPASISMDPLDEDLRERPVFDLAQLPLPIIHKSYGFPLRTLLASRVGPLAIPLDTTEAEQCGTACAEYLEALTAGKAPIFKFGQSSVYGITNHPSRITSSAFTIPTAGGWTPAIFYNELSAALEALRLKRFRGAFVLYMDPAWEQYLDRDWSATKGEGSLFDRIKELRRLTSVRFVETFTGYELALVEMRKRTIRMVNGFGLMTVEWDEQGGLGKNWKVLMMQVPQLRADADGNMAILHAIPS